MLSLDAVHSELLALEQLKLQDGLPAFLFRGECDLYPTTFSSLDRYYHDIDLAEGVHDELDSVTAFCMKTPLQAVPLEPKLAGAFAQHYRLPTQVFDFTASPRVAVNFAANRSTHERPRRPTVGWMGVLDVAQAKRSGLAEVFDLRNFQEAKRAKDQEAFGLIYSAFVLDDHVDLKRPQIAVPLGLHWLPFAHLPDDETYLGVIGADVDFESLDGDWAAGIPQLVIDEFVAREGRLSADAAKLLSELVPSPGRSPAINQTRWAFSRTP